MVLFAVQRINNQHMAPEEMGESRIESCVVQANFQAIKSLHQVCKRKLSFCSEGSHPNPTRTSLMDLHSNLRECN